jgi:xanthine dehydrogenase accessory factor
MTRNPEDIIDCMARMKGDGQPFALATVIRTEDATAAKAGAKAVVRADGTVLGWVGGGCTLGAVRKAAARVLSDGQARLVHVRPKERLAHEPAEAGVELHKSACPSGGSVEVFVEPILPRPALLVAGGSPVARALAELGCRAGFAVTVAALPEDQSGFAEADARIDGFDLTRVPGAGSGYVVVATQGKRDREALAAALSCGAPYVAFVGSRKKAATLRAAMRQAGVPAEQVEALRAPAGLDIGAATAEEIALSILAEIVRERRLAVRSAQPPAVQVEELEDGSMESRIVSPVLGACHGNDGRH